jgi:type II secretory pathway pseudopilin PulG
MRTLTLAALVGILASVGYAAAVRVQIMRRERAATRQLEAIGAAQHGFRTRGGQGGYAASLASLASRCPDGDVAIDAPVEPDGTMVAGGYRFSVSAAEGAASVAVDCHGRPTFGDFLASAVPVRPGIDGARGMSVMAAGRKFMFVDGRAPDETDMGPGGLAVPLDAPIRIP